MKKQFNVDFARLSKPKQILVAQLTGPLDSVSVVQFVDKINTHITSGFINVVLNFEDMDYINSTAIKEVLNLYQDLKKQGGFISIASVNPSVLEILNLVGVNHVIPIFNSQQEAVSGFPA